MIMVSSPLIEFDHNVQNAVRTLIINYIMYHQILIGYSLPLQTELLSHQKMTKML
jgi:hypothetical protein